jgi:FkbM family methyltransferase
MAKIDLATLVSKDTLERVLSRDAEQDLITTTSVRGIELRFQTHSQRQLWQAVGHEHIEPELLDFIDAIPAGSVYYDIGASNGIFACYAAVKGLKVFAFEPEAQNYALLDRNNFLNNGTIKCFNLAISDKQELGKLYSAKFEAAGHLKILDQPRYVGGGEFEPEYVSTVLKYPLAKWIADFDAPQPQYVKIDVDGSEFEVLRGAEGALRNAKAIFIEICQASSQTKSVLQFIENLGFKLQKKVPVQHYDDLFNCIFQKQ